MFTNDLFVEKLKDSVQGVTLSAPIVNQATDCSTLSSEAMLPMDRAKLSSVSSTGDKCALFRRVGPKFAQFYIVKHGQWTWYMVLETWTLDMLLQKIHRENTNKRNKTTNMTNTKRKYIEKIFRENTERKGIHEEKLPDAVD